MMSRANGWLRRWLVNPMAFHLPWEHGQAEDTPQFSVANALSKPRRVLIIPDGRAGGIFLGAPQFWAVRNRYPEAEISLLVRSQQEYIAQKIPFVNDVIVYDEFLFPVGQKLRQVVELLQERDFEIAFCFSDGDSFCPAYLCYKSCAHLRVGFQRDDFPFFNVRIVPKEGVCYEPDRLSLLLRTLGIPEVKERVSWSVSREGAEKIRERYLVGRKPEEHFVGLDVSSGTGVRPSSAQFLAIAEGLCRPADTRALVFFDYEQRKTANAIKEAFPQKSLLFQTDDLPKVVALLEACEGLIACNSDLFHLAVAMGCPATGIFTADDLEQWVPPDREGISILDYDDVRRWAPEELSRAVQEKLQWAATLPAP